VFAPGLIGSLLVGLMAAKGLARALSVPFIGVHHIEGHLMAAAVDADAPKPPFIGLVCSGGHTALYRFEGVGCAALLGQTRDDAAGEAFDKTAKLLGLGYPGGVAVDKLAEGGDASRYTLPISLKDRSTYDFSFSGLKTAVRLIVQKQGPLDEQATRDLCASLRKAIVEALVQKAMLACRRKQVYRLVVGGGVAANSLLRSELVRVAPENEVTVYVPPKRLCTDNAVMIAMAARAYWLLGHTSALSLMAKADLSVEQAKSAMTQSA
jgi:N6-L-threonylcarbamoyladenine synthase